MENVLRPNRVSSRHFTYKSGSRHFVTELSTLEWHSSQNHSVFGPVYADACDEGLTVVSEKTGGEAVFAVAAHEHDREGDLVAHHLVCVWPKSLRDLTMTIFND